MRPLCPASSDPNELSALTPAHFLNMIPASIPDENLEETKSNWLSRWQLVRRLHQQFWSKWKNEYLMELQKRNKWTTKRPNLEIGELVLIKDENLSSSQWAMGRVQEVHPGEDKMTRVVSVKTANNVVRRGINKIAPLPIKYAESEKLVAAYGGIKIPRPTGGQSSCVSSILVAMLAVLMINSGVLVQAKPNKSATLLGSNAELAMDNVMRHTYAGHTVRFRELEESPALYFKFGTDVFVSNSQWTIIAHLNYGKFASELVEISNTVTSFEKYCETEKEVTRRAVHQLRITIDGLSERNEVLRPAHSRRKRAVLDIVGNIAHDLFGVLGSNFEKEYVHDTDKLLANDHHLLMLLRNQTTVIEALTKKIRVRENEKTAENHQHILGELRGKIDGFVRKSEMTSSMATYMGMVRDILLQYELRQGAIFDVFMDARGSIVHPNLMTPKQIIEQMGIIRKRVDGLYIIPDLHELYRVMDVTPMVVGDNMFFKISVPLLGHQRYNAYKIFPIPMHRDSKFQWIIPENQYLVVATDRRQYTMMEEIRLERCKQYHETSRICNGLQLFYGDQSQEHNCEWRLFNRIPEISNRCVMKEDNAHDLVINTGNNEWIFVLPTESVVTSMCGNAVSHRGLKGVYIVTAGSGCELTHKDRRMVAMEMLGQSEAEIEANSYQIEPFHPILMHSIDGQNMSTIRMHNFTHISRAIDEIKANQMLPTRANVHDYHHYTFFYVGLTVVMVVCILRCMKKRLFIRKRATLNKNSPIIVSMPNIEDAIPLSWQNLANV